MRSLGGVQTVLACVAVALALTAVGCGGGDDESGTAADGSGGAATETVETEAAESFDELLRDLRDAAEAGEPYSAIAAATELSKAEQGTVTAFCTNVLQLKDGGEQLSEEEFFLRVKASAESSLGEIGAPPVAAAAKQLRDTYDLASVKGDVANSYFEACFGGTGGPPSIEDIGG